MNVSDDKMHELAKAMTEWLDGTVEDHPEYGWVVKADLDGAIICPLSCQILEAAG